MSGAGDGSRDPLEGIDMRSASEAARVFREGAAANLEAGCRRGSVDEVEAAGTLTATGDLHDNPVQFARVLALARLERGTDERPRRVTLHEIIHGELVMGGLDFSFRGLARAAALKSAWPERVHTLLANHELAQIVGSGIAKGGVRVVDAFDDGVAQVFGEGAGEVQEAIGAFIRSMALALVCGRGSGRGVLCAHSLPAPRVMERFDTGVLDRELTEADYEPRKGSAHLMVWGRGHTAAQLDALAEVWGVGLFVLGHEKAETGALAVGGRAVVLNSDHERGAALEIDLTDPPSAEEAVWSVTPLASVRGSA